MLQNCGRDRSQMRFAHMRPTLFPLLILSIAFQLGSSSRGQDFADEVRYVKDPVDGLTYREVVRTERVPVINTREVEREETVMTERITEISQPYQCVEHRPYVQYWNRPQMMAWPSQSAQPIMGAQVVPVTRWTTQTKTYAMPIVTRQMVPETKLVTRQEKSLGFEERSRVVSRQVYDPQDDMAFDDTTPLRDEDLAPGRFTPPPADAFAPALPYGQDGSGGLGAGVPGQDAPFGGLRRGGQPGLDPTPPSRFNSGTQPWRPFDGSLLRSFGSGLFGNRGSGYLFGADPSSRIAPPGTRLEPARPNRPFRF